ncbi:hypothetical protein G6321_00042945 [Bradyrhizobium barranii subsp. barranii]|uniref:Uncharacterized protein n=1 Tax=Bradyrhizobium barranii subsp. barranii TaxID=2823807 RepID=A0A7Z0QDV8_9BRAD|nr:hypothetical protein [Bradyrhizobium barranii]UGX92400.1 hypothetical protein G6321_00042945 [Bradyrhizobium barranii subsp. barranii]
MASAAADLMFWPDGMLAELEKIAQGNATKKDITALRRKLTESQSRVDEIIRDLNDSRDVLRDRPDGLAVIAQINGLLHESRGNTKLVLRQDILSLLDAYASRSKPRKKKKTKKELQEQESLATRALVICNSIEAFNAAVRRLHRFVFEP